MPRPERPVEGHGPVPQLARQQGIAIRYLIVLAHGGATGGKAPSFRRAQAVSCGYRLW